MERGRDCRCVGDPVRGSCARLWAHPYGGNGPLHPESGAGLGKGSEIGEGGTGTAEGWVGHSASMGIHHGQWRWPCFGQKTCTILVNVLQDAQRGLMPFRGTAGGCWHPLGTITMWVPGCTDVWPWFESHQDLLAPGVKETSRIWKDHPAPLLAAIPKPSHHPGDEKEPVPPASAHVLGHGNPCPSFKRQEKIEICTGKDTQDQTQPLILPESPRAAGLARLGGGEH